MIRDEHGEIPYVLLHLAGLYDEHTAVPTLAEQIRRIYERDPKSHAYSGDLSTGQSFLHRDDMLDAFARTVDRRNDLPQDITILIGEREAMGYDALQRRIAALIHGTQDWQTLSLPKPIAAAGAWTLQKAEPVVPDDFDQGEEPFIKPFMIRMADDHYELDISRAEELLDWRPRHSLREELPAMIGALKADPAGWYDANGLTKPHWLREAEDRDDPDALRRQRETEMRRAHASNIWAQFLNIALGAWMMTAPLILGYADLTGMLISDMAAGFLVMIASVLARRPRALGRGGGGHVDHGRAPAVLDRKRRGLPQRVARGGRDLCACRMHATRAGGRHHGRDHRTHGAPRLGLFAF